MQPSMKLHDAISGMQEYVNMADGVLV